MKNIGFNLKILAQWPQGLPRSYETHFQNPSIKAIIETRISKLSLFTLEFQYITLEFRKPLDFLGFKLENIWEKVEAVKPRQSSSSGF